MVRKDFDYVFKLVLIGNSAVGKSSLLIRFADDNFSTNYVPTIGVDFRFKTATINDKRVRLQIWDTAGQEKFRTITKAYYQGADGVVLVFDLADAQSFEDVENYWLPEAVANSAPHAEFLLLGNKRDLPRQVAPEAVAALAARKQLSHFEVSAKTAHAVEAAFFQLAKALIANKDKALVPPPRPAAEGRAPVVLQAKKEEPSSDCNC